MKVEKAALMVVAAVGIAYWGHLDVGSMTGFMLYAIWLEVRK